jgi:hypothetical protein
VDCIYFEKDVCKAVPLSEQRGEDPWYKITEEDMKNYCQNIAEFRSCPRLIAIQDDFSRALAMSQMYP